MRYPFLDSARGTERGGEEEADVETDEEGRTDGQTALVIGGAGTREMYSCEWLPGPQRHTC